MRPIRHLFLQSLAILTLTFVRSHAADPVFSSEDKSGNFIADTNSMIRVVVRGESGEIKPSDFAALPKTVWRCGHKYLRVNELPDSVNRIHGIMLFREPDVWIINLMGMSAQHVIDRGPTFDAIFPAVGLPSDTALSKLEVGNEIEFFHSRKATQLPDTTVNGSECIVWRTTLEGSELSLYLEKSSSLPLKLLRRLPNSTFMAMIYDEYEVNLRFDPAAFELPKGLRISEDSDRR